VLDWLYEGRLSVYLFLAAIAVALVFFWWQRRKRYFLFGAGLFLVLMGVYYLLDRAVETDREQIVRKLETMAAAVKAKDASAIFQHVSDDFRSPGGKNKKDFQAFAESTIKSRTVTEVKVWGFRFDGDPSRERKTCIVNFQVKVTGNFGNVGELGYPCEATFDFDARHGWRLKGFRLFEPYRDNLEISLPF
jgi:hypothetical protein